MKTDDAVSLFRRILVDAESPENISEVKNEFQYVDLGKSKMVVTKDEVRGAYKYYGCFYSRPDRVITAAYIQRTDNPEEDVLCYDFVYRIWSWMDRDCFDEQLRSGRISKDLEVHILWYLEQEHAFNGEGDNAAVDALLREWTEKKEEYRDAFNYGWPAKYVETTFYLNGKQYSITPDSIGLERGESWDEGFMEYLQGDIAEDLKKLGATEIRNYGFLD